MTSDRDLEKDVRTRAMQAGEPYHAAWRQLRRTAQLSEDSVQAVEAYFEASRRHLEQWRARGGPWHDYDGSVPVAALQAAALGHPNPATRRKSLNALDHAANDSSFEVFRAALRDPVPRVRVLAVHGLSCNRCRSAPLPLDAVIGELTRVMSADDSPKVRHAAVLMLGLLVPYDERARELLERAAGSDPDELVRSAAQRALEDRRNLAPSRKALRRRVRGREGGGGR